MTNKPRKKPRKEPLSPPGDKVDEAEFQRILKQYFETLAPTGQTTEKLKQVLDWLNEFATRSTTVEEPLLAKTKRREGKFSEHKARTTGIAALSRQIETGLPQIFGDNLRLARLELRLSQQDLSDLSGISKRHIGMIERGGNATLATIEALAPHVGRTAVELLTPRASRR